MKIELLFPVREGKPAVVKVIADDPNAIETGFLRVKVGNIHVQLVPCGNLTAPGVDKKRVLATAPPPTHRICTTPAWASGESVTFELFDSADNLVQSVPETVLL